MSCKNITKISYFVTILALFCLNLAGCSLVSSNNSNAVNQNSSASSEEFSKNYQKPKTIGKISSGEITESSGLVASHCNQDVFWTHNDSGDKAFIFAINSEGKRLGTWKVEGAKNYDWEDIAAFKTAGGECFLYLGDTGNNTRGRDEFVIYRVKEPAVSANDSNKKNPLSTEPAEAIKFDYPEARHDAETLMVQPQSGDIYILTKRLTGASGVYKLAANYSTEKTNRLEKIADLSVPALPNGFLTGGDISADGKHVVIIDYFGGYELRLPDNAKNFDEIWKQKPEKIELGELKQGEAICYSVDGKSIYATSEGKNPPLIKVDSK
jgi:hypothetical protein